MARHLRPVAPQRAAPSAEELALRIDLARSILGARIGHLPAVRLALAALEGAPIEELMRRDTSSQDGGQGA